MPAPGIIDGDRIELLRSIGDGDLGGLVEELTTVFRDTRDAYLRDVRDAVAARDAEAIGVSVHAFKASSRSLGATRVVRRCEQIEEAARAGDFSRAEALLVDLGPLIGEAIEALYRMVASGELDP